MGTPHTTPPNTIEKHTPYLIFYPWKLIKTDRSGVGSARFRMKVPDIYRQSLEYPGEDRHFDHFDHAGTGPSNNLLPPRPGTPRTAGSQARKATVHRRHGEQTAVGLSTSPDPPLPPSASKWSSAHLSSGARSNRMCKPPWSSWRNSYLRQERTSPAINKKPAQDRTPATSRISNPRAVSCSVLAALI
jgi:hypothetical protein